MINLSFNLNHQKISKSGHVPVWMLITFKGQRIRKAIKEVKVKPSHWNETKELVKKPSAGEDYNKFEEFNMMLLNIKESVNRINRHALKFNSKVSKEFILKRIDNPNLIEVDRKSFFQTFDEFIEVGRSYKKKRTIQGIQTVRNVLYDYQRNKLIKIDFEDIDQEFFELLRSYCFRENNWSINYFKKIIQVLKAFMNWSLDRDFHANKAYKKFKAEESKKEVIYLTEEELLHLFDYPFELRRLDHVRDIFCFGCCTGFRFSDIASLKSSEVYEEMILKRIGKTKEVNNTLPLHGFTKEILDKYKNSIHEPLPKISAQKFNDYIKECCREAGITNPLTTYSDSGGLRTEVTKPKCDLITSHTARKTFITLSLEMGVPEHLVRAMSGHKTLKEFMKYVKVSDNQKGKAMDNSWDKLYKKIRQK